MVTSFGSVNPEESHRTSRDTTSDLIEHGLNKEARFVEYQLEPGGPKAKVAFLFLSRGPERTGKPRVLSPLA
jgi:hypothetical protein